MESQLIQKAAYEVGQGGDTQGPGDHRVASITSSPDDPLIKTTSSPGRRSKGHFDLLKEKTSFPIKGVEQVIISPDWMSKSIPTDPKQNYFLSSQLTYWQVERLLAKESELKV